MTEYWYLALRMSKKTWFLVSTYDCVTGSFAIISSVMKILINFCVCRVFLKEKYLYVFFFF